MAKRNTKTTATPVESIRHKDTRKNIEGHGGQMSLQSEPGRGTQVMLKLPVLARLPGDGG